MRYCGSKRRFIKALKSILCEHLSKTTTFVDAFGGGMNVVCAIPHDKKVAIELNRYVYALWKHLQENGSQSLPQILSEEQYNDIKLSYLNQDKRYEDWLIGYVGACCSYGGAWFNGYARYNERKKEDHIKEAYNGINKQLEQFENIKQTTFINCSYDEYDYPPNSVIYCDPPYASTKKYESDFDTVAFWEWVRQMSRNGHHVYVSEYVAPSDFQCIWQAEKKDGLGTTKCGKKQNIKIEKLFIYKQ